MRGPTAPAGTSDTNFSCAPAPRHAATSSHPERCARCGAHVSVVPTASGPDAGATAVGPFRRLLLLLMSPWLGRRWGGAELLLLCVNCVCISKGFCVASTPTRLKQLAAVAWMWLVHIVMSPMATLMCLWLCVVTAPLWVSFTPRNLSDEHARHHPMHCRFRRACRQLQ